ncbi:hypothetical protein ACWC2T_15985 [Streptomyces sp. NPDC001393]
MNCITRITRVFRNHDDSRAKRRLGLATAAVSAAVVAGGVMLPAVTASAAPMHPVSAVTMAPRHDHHDRDYWDHHDRHHCGDDYYYDDSYFHHDHDHHDHDHWESD